MMNPVSGHNTLPLAPRSDGMPRSQSSRSTTGSKQLQHQHAKHFITQTKKGGFTSYMASRVNDLPDDILKDRAIPTSAHEDHRRRTIIVNRDRSQGGSFGFTLQTYGIRHKDDSKIELISYVDSLEPHGPAARAGMRAGDVILSINGEDVESVDHNRLIQMIKACPQSMRIVVLFENCVRRVALHAKLLELKRAYQQKITEYNHYVEAERNILFTLRNKGVDIQHLVKGSSELLPLSSASTDVLFPFRKHSKSFNRLSVSHSKSESRLLSDSASNLASSSSTRGRPVKDTSVSCSTLPRLGGRRSSARSLPASTAVTPVGSLDGLEQGTWTPIPLTPPCFVDPSLDGESEDITEDIDEIAERVAEDPFGVIDYLMDSLNEGEIKTSLENARGTVAAYESVYGVDLFDLGASRSPGGSLSESGYLSDSTFNECPKRQHDSDDIGQAQESDVSCAVFPMKPLAQITRPLVMILDCICCKTFGSDPAEGHEHIMSECAHDLDKATRFIFCIFLAICLFMLSNNFLSDGTMAMLFSMTVMFLGM